MAQFGTNVDVGKGITDLLVKYLVQDGTYSVIERNALDKIMAEQNFSNSDRANPNSAAKIGKLLGVDAMIVGSMTQFGNDTKNTERRRRRWRLRRIRHRRLLHKNTKAIVNIDARIVDIDTAEILGVAEGHGESSRSSTSLTGRRRKLARIRRRERGLRHQRFPADDSRRGSEKSVEQMSTGLIADNTKLQVRTIVVSGLVAAVDGGQIVLNVGGKAGLKVGDQLSVERITKEIKDPSTGQVIRRMTSPVGVVRVTDVDDVSAVAAPVSGSGIQSGRCGENRNAVGESSRTSIPSAGRRNFRRAFAGCGARAGDVVQFR